SPQSRTSHPKFYSLATAAVKEKVGKVPGVPNPGHVLPFLESRGRPPRDDLFPGLFRPPELADTARELLPCTQYSQPDRARKGTGQGDEAVTAPSLDSFRGCLLGLALGDALGAPYEGLTGDVIFHHFGPPGDLLANPDEETLLYTDD